MATGSIMAKQKRGKQITELRKKLDLTMEAFAPKIGLTSKGAVSILETTNRCSPQVALNIEKLSDYEIDAASLNDLIARARATAPTAQAA